MDLPTDYFPFILEKVWGAQAVEYWLVDERGPDHLGSLELPVNKSPGY